MLLHEDMEIQELLSQAMRIESENANSQRNKANSEIFHKVFELAMNPDVRKRYIESISELRAEDLSDLNVDDDLAVMSLESARERKGFVNFSDIEHRNNSYRNDEVVVVSVVAPRSLVAEELEKFFNQKD